MKMWSSSTSFLMSSNSHSSESPLHSIAQYIEDYMDLVENVPNDIARQLTQLHEHNHKYHQFMTQLESNIHLISNQTSNELRKRNGLAKIQRCLIEIQEIADEKLLLIQSILDQLDGKARQLDFDYRSVTLFNTTPNVTNNSRLQLNSGNTSAIVTTNHSSAQRSEGNNSSANICNTINSINNITNEIINKEVLNGSSNGASNTNPSNATTTPSTTLSGKRASARRNTTSRTNHDNGDQNAAKRAVKRGVKASNKDLKRSRSNSTHNNNNNNSNNSSLLMANNSPPNIYEGAPIDPDEPTYCLCEQVSFGEMICCDNSVCKIEWFHFSCVSLNTKPKGKWFCPNCRGERSNIPKK